MSYATLLDSGLVLAQPDHLVCLVPDALGIIDILVSNKLGKLEMNILKSMQLFLHNQLFQTLQASQSKCIILLFLQIT